MPLGFVEMVSHGATRTKQGERGVGVVSHLEELLRTTSASLAAGDLRSAARLIDRARRHAPNSDIIAHLHGRLLILQGNLPAGVRWLEKAADLRSSPENEAPLIEAMAMAGRWTEASERSRNALSMFAVEFGGALAASVNRLVDAKKLEANGWAGVAPDLRIVGACARDGPKRVILLTSDGEKKRQQVVQIDDNSGEFCIDLGLDRQGRRHSVTFLAGGQPLLGSPLTWPPVFGFDGRAHFEGDDVRGWVRLDWAREYPVKVLVEGEEGREVLIETEPDPEIQNRRRFTFASKSKKLIGDRLWLSAVLPGGCREPFPDTPLLLSVDAPTFPSPVTGRSKTFHQKFKKKGNRKVGDVIGVDIIIPVYLGLEETLTCIQAVLATRPSGCRVIVVDDASPDVQLRAALVQLAEEKSITLLHSETNRGFPAAVNLGLTLRSHQDVIILNADVVTCGNWVERLQRAAYAVDNIGTVTPFSNRASIASYPGGDGVDVSIEEAREIDRLAAIANQYRASEIPVGVGSCLYVRGDCLNQVGTFDAITFGYGYGEENDFCLRARKLGWRHALAADVFVRHVGARSFGGRRAALTERNSRLINLRYPGYDAEISEFIRVNSLAPLRRRLDEARFADSVGKVVLIVTLALPGGVDRVVSERRRIIGRAGMIPLVLRATKHESERNELKDVELIDEDGRFQDLIYSIPDELSSLQAFLTKLSVAHVELHHFLDIDPKVVDLVLSVGAFYDVYVHDYGWVCPRITLLGGDDRYCGEPMAVKSCQSCVDNFGSSLEEPATVAELRQRSGRWLAHARRVVTPARDVAERLMRYFPDLRPRVRPWEGTIPQAVAAVPDTKSVCVAVIGAIGAQKGFGVLSECARDAANRDLPLEFVVFGYTEDDEALIGTGKAFVTGRYDEAELPELLHRERPHLAFLPSVTPETWCFALTHAMRNGLPVIAFDLGVIAARLRQQDHGQGYLLPIGTEPAVINDTLIAFAKWFWTQQTQKNDVREMPSELEDLHISRKPQSLGGDKMQINGSSSSDTKNGTLTSSAEVITIGQGLYLFYVSTAAPVRTATGAENITVPAVHIGPGPGISPDQVSLLAGPHTKGTWLCEPGNMIVAKVTGGSATLILTSVRNVGGQQLTIEVERLDGRRSEVESRLSPPRGEATIGANGNRPMAPQLPPAPSSPLQLPSPRNGSRVEILTHVQKLGDVLFVDPEWAGGVGQGLWIESFTIKPLEHLPVDGIEYKALTISGFETPWVSGGNSCGTQGMAFPLVAFAVRVKVRSGAPELYDCEYMGCFRSGAVVGPVKNGAPCRSTTDNDPLVGIQVRFVARERLVVPTPAPIVAERPAVGPRFSKLREAAEQTNGNASHHDSADVTVIETPSPAAAADYVAETVVVQDQGRSTADHHGLGFSSTFVDEKAASRSALMKRILPFLTT